MISKKQFMQTLKNGYYYDEDKITDLLNAYVIDHAPYMTNHDTRWCSDEKIRYIWDNDCYLFIFRDRIEVRCDRTGVWSEGMHHKIKITSNQDIYKAYECFKSMTMEEAVEE